MYRCTDSPCFLQDFVPLWGRSPAYLKGYCKQTAQQGKGTDDHLLPLGDWLGAKEHLYKWVCPSVRPSLRHSVGPLRLFIFGGIKVLRSTAWPVLPLVSYSVRVSIASE